MRKHCLHARMTAVLSLLCDEAPPPELLWGWIEALEPWEEVGLPLKQWIDAHCRLVWAMSFDLLDCAQMLAASRGDDE